MCSVAQLCQTLRGPMDCSQPGSSVHRILQARILEWVLFPMPGDIPTPGIESTDSCISSIGRRILYQGFPDSSVSKESACSVGDPGLIRGLGRSPEEGNGYPLQYSCLENPMDRAA